MTHAIDQPPQRCSPSRATARWPGPPRARGLVLLVCTLWPWVAMATPPTFDAVRHHWQPSYAELLDRHGIVLHRRRMAFDALRYAWTPLHAVSPTVVEALIAGEDQRFYRHHGVDWQAVLAALYARVRGNGMRGASTLTMQTAALLDPNRLKRPGQRHLLHKLRQLWAARELERQWSKAEILEAYLNLTNYRGEAQGIAALSWRWFGKAPDALNQAEALLFAALLPQPQATPQRWAAHACRIAQHHRYGVACKTLRDLATSLPVHGRTPLDSARLAPQLAAQWLRLPGERVRTTLDAGLQTLTLETLRAQLQGLPGHNVRDGAALVVDNASGEVLAYVASAGPHSTAAQVDGVRARRQAGSTLKPFLYQLALERRYLTAASILDDSPVQLETTAGLYIPQDYDRNFTGLVSVRTALASSLNLPAVRTLVLVGVEAFRDRLRDLGYAGLSHDGEFYGYSLALGSAEVNLLEQANAYRTVANGGVYSPLRLRPDQPQVAPRRVLDQAATFIVTDMLADRGGRTLTFGLDSALATPFFSAVKTGTSKDTRDNWCIGFSSRYTVAVWVGNFEGDAMHEVSGVTAAAPAWHAIMQALHRQVPSLPPTPPSTVMAATVEYQPQVEPTRREWFLPGTFTPQLVLVDPAQRAPHLTHPPNGAIVAIDPDIPLLHQAITFRAEPRNRGWTYRLDGQLIAAADAAYPWFPQVGKHHLTLHDSVGRVKDEVRFEVRGILQGATSSRFSPKGKT